jgi:hypothetical protein
VRETEAEKLKDKENYLDGKSVYILHFDYGALCLSLSVLRGGLSVQCPVKQGSSNTARYVILTVGIS